jgi:hypothetical protein
LSRPKKPNPDAGKYQPTARDQAVLGKYKAQTAAENTPRVKVSHEKKGTVISLDHPDELIGSALLAEALARWCSRIGRAAWQQECAQAWALYARSHRGAATAASLAARSSETIGTIAAALAKAPSAARQPRKIVGRDHSSGWAAWD